MEKISIFIKFQNQLSNLLNFRMRGRGARNLVPSRKRKRPDHRKVDKYWILSFTKVRLGFFHRTYSIFDDFKKAMSDGAEWLGSPTDHLSHRQKTTWRITSQSTDVHYLTISKLIMTIISKRQKITRIRTKFETGSKVWFYCLEKWKTFKDCFARYGFDYTCYIVGSTSNGFGTNKSDVDICLVINHDQVL